MQLLLGFTFFLSIIAQFVYLFVYSLGLIRSDSDAIRCNAKFWIFFPGGASAKYIERSAVTSIYKRQNQS